MHTKSSVNIRFFLKKTIHCKTDVHNFVIGTNHSSLHGTGSAKDRSGFCQLLSASVSLGKAIPQKSPLENHSVHEDAKSSKKHCREACSTLFNPVFPKCVCL